MSGPVDLIQLGKSGAAPDPVTPPPPSPSLPTVLPHTVRLPTRYYGRIALAATAHAFAEIATVAIQVGDGVIDLTFTRVDDDAGAVIDEFLNHALYASATAEPEARR